MAGSRFARLNCLRLAFALAVLCLSAPAGSRAQGVSQPAPSYADLVASESLGGGTTEAARPRVEMGLFDTIASSIFEDPDDPNEWRPLTLGTFFSEGWREPWAGGPAGQSGLTPRHGWLGSFEGLFYRLWLVDGIYQNNLSKPFGGEGYKGDFAIFLPFSRRFELFLNVPFVTSNGTDDPRRGYRSDFGDMSIAGSFLLSESEAFTQLFTLGTIVPTGRVETGGNLMTIFPRYSFWSNPGGSWVLRGGTGVNVPLNKNDQRPTQVSPGGGVLFGESGSQTNLNFDVAVGRYFTPHDVAFGDLVVYANCNVVVPMEDRNRPTYVGVGPGTRFQITGNWYFLHYWEFPLTGDKPFDYQMSSAVVKAF
jgi:hypothetical protein